MDKNIDSNILSLAAQTLKVTVDEVQEHCKNVPEIDGYYFWNPVRGGIAVLINKSGEKLGATSSVRFEKHLQAFLDGRRN